MISATASAPTTAPRRPRPAARETPSVGTPAELLQQADQLFTDAEAGLKADGDLGAYQQKIEQAKTLVAQALDELQPTTTTTPSSTPPTTGG